MKRRLILLTASVLLAFCTSQGLKQDAPVPPTPDPVPIDWRTKVTDARALDDPPQKHAAMLALLREALSPREVRMSGHAHPDQVHVDDNQPAPIVNFDPRLNQKTSAQSRSGAPSRSLQNNFGYYFSLRGAGYVVLGPAALDPRSPAFTRLSAEHELFHAANHVGDPRSGPDRELETWSQMFVRFFHDVHQFKQQWRPMFGYYDDAAAGERKAAVERLVAYYRNPPSPAGGNTDAMAVRAAFEEWLAKRKADMPSSKLVHDLEKAMAGTTVGS